MNNLNSCQNSVGIHSKIFTAVFFFADRKTWYLSADKILLENHSRIHVKSKQMILDVFENSDRIKSYKSSYLLGAGLEHASCLQYLKDFPWHFWPSFWASFKTVLCWTANPHEALHSLQLDHLQSTKIEFTVRYTRQITALIFFCRCFYQNT